MKNSFILVRLDINYSNYLRKFDSRVPYNYGKKELRPFLGVLFEVRGVKYFAPLTSPKPKHLKLKSKLDFLKLDGGKLGAINFNDMVPVLDQNVIKLDFSKVSKTDSEEKYKKLLQEQLFWLNRNYSKVYGRAKKLYDQYFDGTLASSIFKRCCNFPLLEEKCLEYSLVAAQ